MMSLSQKWTMSLAALVGDFVDLDNCPVVGVEGISLDSRQVQPGDLFVAIKGTEVDGTAYIPQAIDRGAVAVLVEKDPQVARLIDGLIDDGAAIPVLAVENLGEYVSDIAAVFYGQPSANIHLTGITGTNGKTTCSRLLAELMEVLSDSGSKQGSAAFVGTLGYGMVRDTGYQALHDAADKANDQPSAITETGLTTPDAVAMQRILAELVSKGATDIAVEVSSHSLVQRRVAGLQFDTAIFTNLSRDHLDYHGDINAYAAAKSRLFAMRGLRNAVINIDDSVGRLILANLSPEIRGLSYSLENTEADIHCSTIGLSPEGLRASVVTPWGRGEISSPILGKFNLANLLAVIGAAGANGVDLADILRVIPVLRAVPGRMELVGASTEPAVVVDYAHTPDALEKALQALRVHCQGNLWVVFGCGGDRDRGKRAEMGEIAQRCADKVVVTSDNPRTESPDKIIEHILQGTSREVIVESDRRAAIRLAIGSADKNDVVLIAGKGHEDYQILGAQRLPFSDQSEARLALRDPELQEAASSGGGDQ
jgi:UDP-N-acetylmuramoyl-L-alanyl-D-glutamate--2,6-diaminopimelate ligase